MGLVVIDENSQWGNTFCTENVQNLYSKVLSHRKKYEHDINPTSDESYLREKWGKFSCLFYCKSMISLTKSLQEELSC